LGPGPKNRRAGSVRRGGWRVAPIGLRKTLTEKKLAEDQTRKKKVEKEFVGRPRRTLGGGETEGGGQRHLDPRPQPMRERARKRRKRKGRGTRPQKPT